MLIAALIFLLTLILVIWQPKGLSIGWSASVGAIFAFVFGVVNLDDLAKVWGIVWNATLSFIAIIIISLLLEAAGFFKWAALHVARLGKGKAKRLYVFIILLGALVSAFFANDGAALILTPIVIAMLYQLGFQPATMLAFVMGAGFIADTASLPLVVSNLVNIVSADYFDLTFSEYAQIMVPVNLVSVITTLCVVYLYFKKDIPNQYEVQHLESPTAVIKDPLTLKVGWLVLVLLLVGFFLLEPLGIPISVIAMSAALILALVALKQRIIPVAQVIRQAPWTIVVFSLGMYLVVYGLRNAGLTDYLTIVLNYLADGGIWLATLGTGFLIAILSSVMNNMPTVLIGALSIDESSATDLIREAMIYANIVGSDLGPKITPIGSLATLLWLHVLGQYKLKITWGYYFKVGICLTVPILLTTLVALVLRLSF